MAEDLSNMSDEEWQKYKADRDAGTQNLSGTLGADVSGSPADEDAEVEAARQRLDRNEGSDLDAKFVNSADASGQSMSTQKAASSSGKRAMTDVVGTKGGAAKGARGGRWDDLTSSIKERYPNLGRGVSEAVRGSWNSTPLGVMGNAMGGVADWVKDHRDSPTDEAKPPGAVSPGGQPVSVQPQGQSFGSMGQPSYAPVQHIPGHWQNAGRTTKDSQLTSDEAESVRKSTDAANGLRFEVAENAAEGEKARVDAGVAAAAYKAHIESKTVADMQKQQAETDQAVASKMAAVNDAMKQYDVAKGGLADVKTENHGLRGKLFGDSSTAGGILGAIGMAMGAAGAALNGGPNRVAEAMTAINQKIQTDLDKQQKLVDAAGNRVGLARNALGDAFRVTGDKATALEAARVQQLRMAESQAGLLAAKALDPDAKAKALAVQAAIHTQIAETTAKVAQLTHAQVVRTEKYVPPQTVGGPPKAAPQDPEKEKLFVPTDAGGNGYYARSEKEAEQGRALQYAKETMLPKLARLKELRAKTSAIGRQAGKITMLQSPEYAEMNSIQHAVQADVRRVESIRQGFSPALKDAVDAMAGDWTSPGGHPEAAADAFTRTILDQAAALERGQAGQGARNTMALDEYGRPQSVAVPKDTMSAPKADMPPSFKPLVKGQKPPPAWQSPEREAAPRFQLPPKAGKGGKGHKAPEPDYPEEDDGEESD